MTTDFIAEKRALIRTAAIKALTKWERIRAKEIKEVENPTCCSSERWMNLQANMLYKGSDELDSRQLWIYILLKYSVTIAASTNICTAMNKMADIISLYCNLYEMILYDTSYSNVGIRRSEQKDIFLPMESIQEVETRCCIRLQYS